MKKDELVKLLKDVSRASVAVIGDFAIDAYLLVDEEHKENSEETGILINSVKEQKYSLGGAGNVAGNLAAMGVKNVYAYGVVGEDPYADCMLKLLRSAGVNTRNMVVQKKDWATQVFTKPILNGKERARIDFGNLNNLDKSAADRLLGNLDKNIPRTDIIVINQQVLRGLNSAYLVVELKKIIRKYPGKIFICDCRQIADRYDGAYRKINAREACRLCGAEHGIKDMISYDETKKAIEKLHKKWGRPVFVTRGEKGCLVRDGRGLYEVLGLHIVPKIDAVGAGDSMIAGIAAALASGRNPQEAAEFGNLVAGITVQKLMQTGTAEPKEILEIGRDPDYIYKPDLAEDVRKAKYFKNTKIEITVKFPEKIKITHAIFDNDGTISTLRQGWEGVMEPVMMRSVLGDKYDNADKAQYKKAQDRVREYIDKTTGIQTLAQMKGLVEIVREFGMVSGKEILDEFGYKKIYNDDLMQLVNKRIEKLRKKKLSAEDYTMKGALRLLEILHKSGIKMYLASGTDKNDVINEAKALGYAHFFEGRIYGAVGDINKEAKRMVIDKILSDIGESNVCNIIAFGDGPVEIRETHKRGGMTVGVASDEIRRCGLNIKKRIRLIKAGADMIIPDFSRIGQLLKILNINYEPRILL